MNSYVVIASLLLVMPGGPIAQIDSADAFRARWNDETNQKLLRGVFWTVNHTIADEKQAELSLQPVMMYLDALTKGDRAVLEPGAIALFKRRLSALLDDPDQAIRALGAVLLGICGDKSYATQLARLLEPRAIPGDLPRFDRGRAAIALGLVGATEYTRELAGLLKSKNFLDRSGAALGLGILGAREYEQAIAALLNDPEGDVSETAKESLAMMRRKPR